MSVQPMDPSTVCLPMIVRIAELMNIEASTISVPAFTYTKWNEGGTGCLTSWVRGLQFFDQPSAKMMSPYLSMYVMKQAGSKQHGRANEGNR